MGRRRRGWFGSKSLFAFILIVVVGGGGGVSVLWCGVVWKIVEQEREGK